MKYSIIYLASILFSFVAAAHSTTANPHKRLHKKRVLPVFGSNTVTNSGGGAFNPGAFGLPAGQSNFLPLPNTHSPSSSSSGLSSTAPGSSSSIVEVTVTSVVTTTITSGSTTPPSSSTPSSSGTTSVLDPTSTWLPVQSSSAPTLSSPSVTSAPGPSTSGDGGLLDPVTSALSGILNPPTSSSSAPPSAPTTVGTSSNGGILDPVTSAILNPPVPSSSAPSAPTTSSNGGILDPVTSALSGVLDPPAPSSSAPSAPTTSSDGGILDPVTSALSGVLNPPAPSSSAPPAPTSSNGGILDPITSILNPPAPSSSATGPTPTDGSSAPSSSSASSGGGILDPITSILSSILDPLTSQLPTSAPTSGGLNSTSTDVSSTQLTISFPTSITSSAQPSESSVVATTTISVNSDLSFVLTETQLAFTSISKPTSLATLSNPDGNPTSVADSAPTPATTLSAVALPTGIPARIYPNNILDTNSVDKNEFTLISILFDAELNWPFVVKNDISSSQIFAYMPSIIANSLGIDGSQVSTFALQVYVPSSYQSPADSIQLGTMFLAYIPADRVNDLAALIKAKNSAFYDGLGDPVATQLADHVNSGFSLMAVADPNGSGTNSSSGASNSAGSSSGGSNNSRQDAIIGVVSALGSVGLLVLGFLIYRSVQRKRALAHRRLSDMPQLTDEERERAGYRPDGREFDRDSVGGQRRRSFYFAEDSLRGWDTQQQQQQQQPMMQQGGEQGGSYSYLQEREGAPGMSRRNVGPMLVPGAISAPILRENTMNW